MLNKYNTVIMVISDHIQKSFILLIVTPISISVLAKHEQTDRMRM
jgi:hypothetical protein